MSHIINNFEVKKTYSFPFGKVDFYSNFLITELNEGVNFGIEEALEISELVTRHFKEIPFGYISNRVNSYSLTPVNYLKIKEVFPTIKAFAAVTYSEMQKSVIKVENSFLNGMLADFDNLSEAVMWVQSKLDQEEDS